MTLEQIKQAQELLKGLGLYLGSIDGIVGSGTKRATELFQTMHGLESDGIIGPLTWAAMFPSGVPDRDTPMLEWPKQDSRSMTQFFGEVGTNQGKLELPYPMKLAWDLSIKVQSITMNRKCIDSAGEAFTKVATIYSAKDREYIGLDLFGGCLNVRKMRGGSNWSVHSWGAAIDIDPARNQLNWDHNRARLARSDAQDWFKAWEEQGWVSLGKSRDFDWMHCQAARL